MPKIIENPTDPNTYRDRDLTLSVRLLPDDRVAVEHLKRGLDTSRVAIVRALVRAGLAATGRDPQRLAEHLVVAP